MLAYLSDFKAMPPIMNLVEPDAPKRGDLLARYREVRRPLRAMWLPFFVLDVMSPPMILLQKILLKSKNPINIKTAFSSERYDSSLAASVLSQVEPEEGVDEAAGWS